MDASQSDEALLESFAASRDEQAFRTLARRYSGLIFHTAIRTVEDRALAEDVGQRVLLALAKKAAQIARGKAP
ncbi:MAG: sigma-70 family RNA polymerase sigma factor, partial [Luteolibacter sp.]